MPKKLSNFIFIVTVSAFLINCANRGTPQGGLKDKEPPKILKSVPENYSTNFTGKEIKIYFDEYIKIKNLQKQLIISPPMKTQPEILPLGSASKYISIKIFDTLQPNMTYAFNFGQSVVDNNEENPFPFYRYVFSTGDYIDSLTVKGEIFDAEKLKPEEFVSVMLYEIDSTYTDSIVYKDYPKYVTNTLDSVTTFTIENLKAGTYKLIALKDENQDNKFQQQLDKIGFQEGTITVPTDSLFNLTLFKEETDFEAKRASQTHGNKIVFGFNGNSKNMKINLLDDAPTGFKYRAIKDQNADTLNYWYTPKFEVDSIVFNIINKEYSYQKDSLVVKIKDKENDSLVLKTAPNGAIGFEEFFEATGNTPLAKINNELITIINKDSLNVEFNTSLDTLNNKFVFDFKKAEDEKYSIQLLPGAIIDMFEKTNDTTNAYLRTKLFSDYGNVRVTLQNAKYPVIVQLTDEKGEVKAEKYSEQPEPIDFRFVTPAKYYIRVIFDTNKNKKWDSGSFLKQQQAERISYYPTLLDARAGWDLIETFTLD